jgi:hypothetical protein
MPINITTPVDVEKETKKRNQTIKNNDSKTKTNKQTNQIAIKICIH